MAGIWSLIDKYSIYKKYKIKSKKRDNELRENLIYLQGQGIDLFEPNRDYSEKLTRFNKAYLGGYKNKMWNKFFVTASGIESEKFIPLGLFANFIEPQLNDVSHIPAFTDKNIYDFVFSDFNRPETVLRISNGTFLDSDYNLLSPEEAEERFKSYKNGLFVKPSWRGSGMGRGTEKFSSTEFSRFKEYLGKNSTDFIVQRYQEQHPTLKNLHANSLNTLKMVTCRVEGQIQFLSSRFRVGRGGNIVDEGGYFLGTDSSGKLTDKGYDYKLRPYTHHEDSRVEFAGIVIPGYEEAIAMCKKMHEKLLHFDLVSWDIAIDEHGEPVMIEMNLLSQGMMFVQIVNGPLFGDYTEAILEKIKFNSLVNV